MSLQLDDTIAAPASAAGSAVRGILRLSGPDVRQILDLVFRPDDQERWNSSKALRHSGNFHVSAILLPMAVEVLLWPGRRSYTAEPLAEIHAPGSPPLLAAMLTELTSVGARLAQPGEFTLRAFLAGRMDLVQAEAVLGVVQARAPQELQSALAQLAGGISGTLSRLRDDLLNLLADLEAGLDFTDEGIEFVSRPVMRQRIEQARDMLRLILAQAVARGRSDQLPRVVLAGLPNAGKSALFNALAGKQHAMVSNIPGTTRDYLNVTLEWSGVRLELVDTAGWEVTTDGILHAAIALRDGQIDRADLVVWCTAADDTSRDFQRESVDQNLPAGFAKGNRLSIITKSDLLPPPEPGESHGHQLAVSSVTGAGLDSLRSAVIDQLTDNRPAGELVRTTAVRCESSLRGAIEALERALDIEAAGEGDEFLAMDVREAVDEIATVTGAVYTDDILDRIFSRFCIGK